MTEDIMYNDLKEVEKKTGKVEFSDIETGGTCLGFPDVYYSHSGHSGLLELKIGKEKKRKGEIHLVYQPGQQRWLTTNRRLSNRIYVLAWFDGIYYLINEKFTKDVYNSKQDLSESSVAYFNKLQDILFFI